jgi:hypothetical protein
MIGDVMYGVYLAVPVTDKFAVLCFCGEDIFLLMQVGYGYVDG